MRNTLFNKFGAGQLTMKNKILTAAVYIKSNYRLQSKSKHSLYVRQEEKRKKIQERWWSTIREDMYIRKL